MTVSVIPNLTRERAAEITSAVCGTLRGLGVSCQLDEALSGALPPIDGAAFVSSEELYKSCDFVIAIGGDGSVIRAAKAAAPYGKKLIGINAGRLAYLCELDPTELDRLSALVCGEYTVKKRLMLRVEFYENGALRRSDACINDVTFARGREIRLVDISVKANGKPIADYVADGVIFATPTGSTAYSMSAGGPIIEPTVDVISLTPVSPHSLICRPYIFAADTVFEVTARERDDGEKVYFSCDGGDSQLLPPDGYVKITRAETDALFVSVKPDNFIDVLNKKLEIKK
ncbi:MAG: NAD(+)/NADH kinase [Clostridia bacterium]|nr:NAD(+)/NADH kinase [Clostridia bacterium]